jgi:hypothetical protein
LIFYTISKKNEIKMHPSMNAPFSSIIISNMSSEQTFQLMNESVSVQLAMFYENIAKESAIKAVLKCAEMYGFDGNEAIQRLGLMSQKATQPVVEPVIRESIREALSPPQPVAVVPMEPVVVKKSKPKTDKKSMVISKPAFPLPYNGEMNEDLCHALVLNEALFTQCPSFPKDGGAYCVKCAKQCLTTENGKPMYGTIQDRQKVGIMEYVDPKNRVPFEYVKVMNKYKVSRDDVIAEASKYNMTIDPIHFEIADKKKGRPKNPTTRVVENTNEADLFKDLISSKQDVVAPSPPPATKAPATKAGNNAKDAEKQRKLEEKLEEKKQKEEEKKRKLEEKLEEKKQKEEEKKRKLAAEKKPKVAPTPKKKSVNVEDTKKDKEECKNEEDDEDKYITVNDTICFNYNGKEYHRSIETNNVYLVNPDNQVSNIVGTYDELTKTIIYSDSKLYDDEESEDSYDEEEDEPFRCGQYGESEEVDEYACLVEEYDQFEL